MVFNGMCNAFFHIKFQVKVKIKRMQNSNENTEEVYGNFSIDNFHVTTGRCDQGNKILKGITIISTKIWFEDLDLI
jgi:hypothetical protein